ncbi:hypothetical protein VN12_15730 [Pirellula sp. SH-Sr6A]|nr:hypothetical protein VN12_15730 [Pirellula sp. SH-Sr6A]
MTGDAPKDFLGVYEYGAPGCKRGRQKSWPRYIAKVGHKMVSQRINHRASHHSAWSVPKYGYCRL